MKGWGWGVGCVLVNPDTLAAGEEEWLCTLSRLMLVTASMFMPVHHLIKAVGEQCSYLIILLL